MKYEITKVANRLCELLDLCNDADFVAQKHKIIYKTNYDEFSGGACTANCVNAADIISTLQTENERLHDLWSDASIRLEDELAENEKLREKLEALKDGSTTD